MSETSPSFPPAGQAASTALAASAADPAARIALLAITRHGVALAARLAAQWPQAAVYAPARWAAPLAGLPNPCRIYEGAVREQIGPLLAAHEQIVCFVSLGAVVRLIAPHLQGKEQDPGVIVVDEAGRFAISVLSGHVGGANEWTQRVAAALGATPVVTTASEVHGLIAVDILGRERGWQVHAPKAHLTRAAAAVVNGEPVAFVQEAGCLQDWWPQAVPLPAHIRLYARLQDVPLHECAAVLWATAAETQVPPGLEQQLDGKLVIYRVPQNVPASASAPASAPAPQAGARYAIGLGCDSRTPVQTLRAAVAQALAQAGVAPQQIVRAASITLKENEPGLLALVAEAGWPMRFYAPAELAAVPVPNPSETVLRYTGTPSVSEAAALLAAGQGAGLPPQPPAPMQALVVEKHRLRGPDGRNATVSLARIAPPHAG